MSWCRWYICEFGVIFTVIFFCFFVCYFCVFVIGLRCSGLVWCRRSADHDMIIIVVVGSCLLQNAFTSPMAALGMLIVLHCAEERSPVSAWASWFVCVAKCDVVNDCGV